MCNKSAVGRRPGDPPPPAPPADRCSAPSRRLATPRPAPHPLPFATSRRVPAPPDRPRAASSKGICQHQPSLPQHAGASAASEGPGRPPTKTPPAVPTAGNRPIWRGGIDHQRASHPTATAVRRQAQSGEREQARQGYPVQPSEQEPQNPPKPPSCGTIVMSQPP